MGAAQRTDDTTVTLTNSVLVGPGAHLTLHAPATTLRMPSTPTGFTSLVGWNGSIELTGTPDQPLTVTSWDPTTGGPDQQVTDAILDGWGERNTFHNNAATLNAPGYAINITRRHLGNIVSCTNRATNAELSNVGCQ